MLSMRENGLVIGLAWPKFGYSLAQHARKLVTCLLSMRKPPAVTRLSVPFTVSRIFIVSRPISPVLRLCSLSPVLCLLSNVSIPCLMSAIACLSSLFLVSRLCPLSLVSVPYLSSLFLVSCLCPLSLFSRPLYSISHYLSPFSFSIPDPYQMSVSFFMALFYSPCPLSSVPCLSYLRDCKSFLWGIQKKGFVPLTLALLNLPKGKSLGRSKPATNS
jgi:hypothetical protein